MTVSRKDKCVFLAKQFMAEDPAEYAGETLEEVTAQIEKTHDEFIDFTYDAYRGRPV